MCLGVESRDEGGGRRSRVWNSATNRRRETSPGKGQSPSDAIHFHCVVLLSWKKLRAQQGRWLVEGANVASAAATVAAASFKQMFLCLQTDSGIFRRNSALNSHPPSDSTQCCRTYPTCWKIKMRINIVTHYLVPCQFNVPDPQCISTRQRILTASNSGTEWFRMAFDVDRECLGFSLASSSANLSACLVFLFASLRRNGKECWAKLYNRVRYSKQTKLHTVR